MKRTKKAVSTLLTVAMCASLAVPFGASPALAAGNLQALSVPTVADNADQQLGDIKVTVDAGSIKNGNSIIFKIPSGYDFDTAFSTGVSDSTVVNGVYVPATINADGDANGLLASDITVKVLDKNDEVQITANNAQSLTNDFVFYIHMRDVNVEDGTNDDCTVTFAGPANTGFPKGTVVNAKCSDSGSVDLTVSGDDTDNDSFDFDLRIEESVADSLSNDAKSLKFKLPAGFKWTVAEGAHAKDGGSPVAGTSYVNTLWGEDATLTYSVDDEELTVAFSGDTTVASAWEVTNLSFTVDDESKVKAGEIICKVTGDTTANVKELVVGTYGEYGVTIKAKDTPTILAGNDEQEIGDLIINEDMKNTLVEGRTITLTLPEGARWQPAYAAEQAGKEVNNTNAPMEEWTTDEGLDVDFTGYVGGDYRTAKFTVKKESGDASEIKLEDVEIATEAGFDGDLVIKVAGTAGLEGEVVAAKVVSPITAEAKNAPNVVIGMTNQVAADFTITEKVAEAFQDEDGANTVVLDLPAGVTFVSTPSVEVTSGDLRITNVRRGANDNQVWFDIDNQSTTPSTITVTGAKLKVDRTVPEGAINISVQGDAAVETASYADWTNSDTAAKVTVANVATPAAEAGSVTFNVGSAVYSVAGAAKVMDVAPYIKNGRTYVPVKYLAMALGVSEENIKYENGVVTLINGETTLKLTIGDKTLMNNETAVVMDVAPEVVNGRTMLPARYVAEGFGAQVGYANGQVVIAR